jgi:GntR family transcriptional repressor for pyruvate dehydrogenase complex
VVTDIIETIKQALISKELTPGSYLPSETELTAQLGVGKSSVREAIKMLQAMGVVEVKRGQGTLIRTAPGDQFWDAVSFQMIMAGGVTSDLLQFRLMYEPAYTIMAMHNATADDLEEISETIHRLEEAINNNEPAAEHDVAFHRAIIRATHNQMAIAIGNTLMDLIEPALGTSMKMLPETALKDHKAIFKGIIEKDPAAIQQAISESSKSWETYLTFEDSADHAP